jgi:sensor histidine kinase YesM
MKKKLSPYWWCQIGGWGAYCLLGIALALFAKRSAFIPSFIPILFLIPALGIPITHVMRSFLIKSKLLQLNVLKQSIFILLTTVFFAFIYSVIIVSALKVFQWGKFSTGYSFLKEIVEQSSYYFWVLLIWNTVYFFYHYVKKSHREEIERIRLENELQLQKLESKKQLADLEMQALRAQMSPHFIFNSLNSISRFILKNQRIEANDYLTKFSRLIRLVLHNSAMPTVKLANELNNLQLYVELECLRFDKKIVYEFQCDPDLDIELIEIPPLLLQPYIENAIWHGLMLKKEEGHLWIRIEQKEQYLVCSVTDDGIGRKKAAELKNASAITHKSIGMNITAKRIAMIQKMDGENKSVEIRDLVDKNGCAAGTEVVLRIPVIMS